MRQLKSATAFLQRIVTRDRPAATRWTLSIGLFVVAFAIRYLLNDELPVGFPYLTFFPAVIISTLVAGLWPGVVNAVLGGVASWIFFIGPGHAFALTPGAVLALAFYIGIVSVDIFIIHGISITSRHLKNEREQLRRIAGSRQQALEKLKESEDRQRILASEMSHRLKNTLAMVQAVASQTLKPVKDREHIVTFQQRIQALSSAHDILVETNWSSAAVIAIVKETTQKLGSFDRLDLRGPDIMFGPAATLKFSLLLHELTTNAFKYGSLSSETGRISLTWDIRGEGKTALLQLEWAESGGPEVSEPTRQGFGSKLIAMGLTSSGSVTLTYPPSGFRAVFCADLIDLQRLDDQEDGTS